MKWTLIFGFLCGTMLCFSSSMTACAAAPTEMNVPPLPDAVDSFGAAELDDWLYVYGGHQGPQQQRTGKNLSRHFVRCNLNEYSPWETLPLDKPLESLALVSSGRYVYRIGGLGLANTEDADGPLCSVDDFVRFDPNTNEWTSLPPLPSARSSHDAIAVEGKIYVVGGLHQNGNKIDDWHDAALVFNINGGKKSAWESLPIPLFRRRNLAVATWQNCIWAIGGKDDNDVIHRSVFCFDPQRGYWSEGPEIPQRVDGLQGYGVAAWGLVSGLYVSGADGALYRLGDVYGKWEQVAELRVQRFCHRLLPESKTTLLALAGYSVSFGQTRSVERIKVYSP
jgi:hypothetical protein